MTTVKIAGHDIDVRENALDRVIRWVDPVRAQRRLGARAAYALAGGYSAGRRDKRSLSSWKPAGNSADADILGDLPTLRERSRDLVRNEALASGALNTVATNVVGTGLMPKARVDRDALGWDEEQAAAWQRATEREFRLWGESPACDATRTQNFYGLQDLALRSMLENGDVFTLLPFIARRGAPYQLAVQLIEADRICNKDSARDTAQLAGGVALDAYGAPIAYHILNQHPGDLLVTKREWTVYAAFGGQTGRRNVLHHYAKRRVGQTRGVPYFAAVIEPFKQLGRYSEAEIFAAVASAMFAIVTKTEDRGGLSPLESAVSGTTPTTSDAPKGDGWDGTLTAGLAVDLGMNESISAFQPGRPNPQFDPFVQAILRQIGVSLELPFEVLIKHFTASYSAARSALLEAWKFYRCRRTWLADSFCQPVYAAWMEEAVALGRIDAPGFFDDPLVRAAYLGAEWQGDGPGSIDPLKEVLATGERIQVGLTTLQKETAAYDGSDWEANHAQQVIEHDKRAAAGLLPAPLTAAGSQAGALGAAAPDAADAPPGGNKKQAAAALLDSEDPAAIVSAVAAIKAPNA